MNSENDFIRYRLEPFHLRPEHLDHLTKLINSYIQGYFEEEVLDDWIGSLEPATVSFNVDTNGGEYRIKFGVNQHWSGTEIESVKAFLRHNQLQPIWAGTERNFPKGLDSIYTYLDVPKSFIDTY